MSEFNTWITESHPQSLTCRSGVGPENCISNKFPGVADGTLLKWKQSGEWLPEPNSNQ